MYWRSYSASSPHNKIFMMGKKIHPFFSFYLNFMLLLYTHLTSFATVVVVREASSRPWKPLAVIPPTPINFQLKFWCMID